jgi:oxygen-independent coproporphyrinogen-3 oxidase
VAGDVALLRESGIRNINIDLIAGLSGQTIPSWSESLNWIERLAPPHVSIYMLEVDEDSRLGNEVLLHGRRYGAPQVPPDDVIVELYTIAVGRLAQLGIRRYEISNFAQPGWESVHNLKYWRLEPYVGFGADAHSFDGHRRRWNAGTVGEYVERASPVIGSVEAKRDEERFYVGLRLAEGICPTRQEWRRFEVPISRFLAEGLLARAGDVLRLTDRGILISNEVFQGFLTT